MRTNRPHRFLKVSASLLCFILMATVFAWAASRKPGLWEITSTMTWQQSPMPNGAPPPGPMSGSHTSQVCLTQAMIDKYGAPLPQSRNDCQVTNVRKGEHSMTAEMVCSGRMTGKGTLESSWTDAEHATGKVHFTGTAQFGPTPHPIEWTSESTSVFKGDDCGSVKPVEPNSK